MAFPTETVFGLGVKFGSHQALDALYELKHRDKGKAISMMISKAEDIENMLMLMKLQKTYCGFYAGNDHYHFKETPTY